MSAFILKSDHDTVIARANNLHELIIALERTSPDKTFKHHINRKRNDFSEWARNHLKDKALSQRLLRNPHRTLDVLKERRTQIAHVRKIEKLLKHTKRTFQV